MAEHTTDLSTSEDIQNKTLEVRKKLFDTTSSTSSQSIILLKIVTILSLV